VAGVWVTPVAEPPLLVTSAQNEVWGAQKTEQLFEKNQICVILLILLISSFLSLLFMNFVQAFTASKVQLHCSRLDI